MSEDDETTRVIRRRSVPTPESEGGDETIKPPTRSPKASSAPPPLPATTGSELASLPEDADKTRVFFRSQSGETKAEPTESSSPTVGWLVIMEGPGRGTSVPLGFGMNHLGRSAANRIVLDFGDEEISRKTHTTLTYDPRGKKFYIQPGPDATNLTYLGEGADLKPVLTPIEIFGNETVLIGRTKLKFIAFCGSHFSWD